MTDRRLDALAARLARAQHGVFHRRQVLAGGSSPDAIDGRLASGAWIRLAAGVYALPGNPPTWLRQAKAAELVHPAAALSGSAAGALHALSGVRRGRIEITVPPTARSRSALARVRRRADVQTVRVDGIRVTTVAETILDLAGEIDERTLRAVVHDAIAADGALLAAIRDRFVERSPSRFRGIASIRSVLEELGEDAWQPTESELERELQRALVAAGVAGVRRQGVLPWWAPGEGRVDVVVPAARLIIEADGRRWHTRVGDFERDRRRDDEAVAHGWRVLRFTWRQLRCDPFWVRRILASTLAGGPPMISGPVRPAAAAS